MELSPELVEHLLAQWWAGTHLMGAVNRAGLVVPFLGNSWYPKLPQQAANQAEEVLVEACLKDSQHKRHQLLVSQEPHLSIGPWIDRVDGKKPAPLRVDV